MYIYTGQQNLIPNNTDFASWTGPAVVGSSYTYFLDGSTPVPLLTGRYDIPGGYSGWNYRRTGTLYVDKYVTMSFYFKNHSARRVVIRLYPISVPELSIGALEIWADPTTWEVSLIEDHYSPIFVENTQVTYIRDGWYKCEITFDYPTTCAALDPPATPESGFSFVMYPNAPYTGTIDNGGCYIWLPQVEENYPYPYASLSLVTDGTSYIADGVVDKITITQLPSSWDYGENVEGEISMSIGGTTLYGKTVHDNNKHTMAWKDINVSNMVLINKLRQLRVNIIGRDVFIEYPTEFKREILRSKIRIVDFRLHPNTDHNNTMSMEIEYYNIEHYKY